MQRDTTKIWTRAEIGVSVGKILVESLGVDEATVTDQAALVRDLGAESIDFLDISFKCQQSFGVDLPARLIQDRLIEWRDLGVLAKVVERRYGLTVSPEELRTIAPATVAAVLQHLGNKHGVESAAEDIFDDHFPGYPILPGALVVETFEQASQLLIGVSHDFARVGRLRGVQRGAFRHFVRPGDQLRVRCARTAGDDDAWTLTAT